MRGEVATASNILFALLVFTVGGCCVLALWCLYASEAQVWGNVGGHHAQPSLYASLDGTQIIFMGSFACGVFIGMVTALLMKYSKIGVRSTLWCVFVNLLCSVLKGLLMIWFAPLG